ncbi:MAG TPA: adenosylcobinamide-phosphate synthase CbiB [Halomicronema sp.]
MSQIFLQNLIILPLAATLDYLIGDPWGWPHPVRVMGWVITNYTQLIFKLPISEKNSLIPTIHRLAGIILGISLILGSAICGWGLIFLTNRLSPWLAFCLEVIILASCFAGRSLRNAAEEVLQPLQNQDIIQSRQKLSNYVGRDTDNLSETEILRAVLETVTENAVDGVLAPLFYAILGSFAGGAGALSFALAYKAASTLDSMVGYKTEPYKNIGWFSAKLEDIITWFPCRLAVLTLGLISGKIAHVWQICQRDAIKDPSPNSGWSEGAYAAILDVQVGGINYYKGQIKEKPLLGDALSPITPATIQQALQLTRHCFLLWLTISLILQILITYQPFILNQISS